MGGFHAYNTLIVSGNKLSLKLSLERHIPCDNIVAATMIMETKTILLIKYCCLA